MNILTDKLPTAVMVKDKVFNINSNFRTCLNIIMAFEDKTLIAAEKQIILLKLFYGEIIPDDLHEACKVAVRFLNCGEDKTDEQEPTGSNLGRLYSFTKDARYIFTAINQTHGVDLESTDYLHWWKFNAFFMDLKEDCFFCTLTHLRKQKKLGKLTKEEREWYYSIQDIADLEDDEIVDENLDEFMSLLNKGDRPLEK